jgi:hypothetical protein
MYIQYVVLAEGDDIIEFRLISMFAGESVDTFPEIKTIPSARDHFPFFILAVADEIDNNLKLVSPRKISL